MNKREITLPDGRYLIFYNFEDTAAEAEAEPRAETATRPGGADSPHSSDEQAGEKR